MKKNKLGRTDLTVTQLGLGCGGHSALGLKNNKTEENALKVIQKALELGINYIDTAERYVTEQTVGKALAKSTKDELILSTKFAIKKKGILRTGYAINNVLEKSLKNLNRETIDIYYAHAVNIRDYDYVCQEIYPVLEKAKKMGKIQYIGITEAFGDTTHKTLTKAAEDNIWDVLMVGFNFLNQTARAKVLSKAIQNNIGIVCMFAVRKALINPENIRPVLDKLIADGQINASDIDQQNPLAFIQGKNKSYVDAAYRFCRDEPGIHNVLSGTGSISHLEENVISMQKPPLPEDITLKLQKIFQFVDSAAGNLLKK